MKCPYCGRETEEGSKFCKGCGNNLNENKSRAKTVSVSEDNNNGNGVKIVAVILVILVLIGIIVGVILLTRGGSDNSNNEETNSENTSENNNGSNNNGNNNKKNDNGGSTGKKTEKELISNIDTEINCELLNYSCLITVTNNNDEQVDLIGTKVVYHDSAKDVDILEHSPLYAHGLDGHKKDYILTYIGSSDLKYDSIDVDFEIQKDFKSKCHVDDVEVSSELNETKKEIDIKIKNNAGEQLDRVLLVGLFYQDGKLVAAEYDKGMYKANGEYTDTLGSKEEATSSIKYPTGLSYKTPVAFDNYEIVVAEAYTKK